jgi:hypothetical protein
MPTLPFEELDALVLDRVGKEISGAGMDTNVVGRMEFAFWEPEPERPDVKRIYVRSLTEPSLGNGIGAGQADVAHADFFAALDPSKALVNGITSSAVRSARLPPIVETDRAGLATALSTVGAVEPGTVRAVRATDTMHLERIYASEALVAEAREREDLRVVREPEPIAFDEHGDFDAPSPTVE